MAITLRLVVAAALSTDQESALIRWVQEKLGYPFEVRLEVVDDIPLGAGGKFADFVSAVATS